MTLVWISRVHETGIKRQKRCISAGSFCPTKYTLTNHRLILNYRLTPPGKEKDNKGNNNHLFVK